MDSFITSYLNPRKARHFPKAGAVSGSDGDGYKVERGWSTFALGQLSGKFFFRTSEQNEGRNILLLGSSAGSFSSAVQSETKVEILGRVG